MDNCLSALKGVEKLALHSCCGPCSSACIVRLASHFEITVFYYNPNIDTLDEYTHRAGEQRRLIAEMPTPNPVQFVDACYTPAEFEAVANPFGAEQEGGSRCTACYALRLERTAIFAREREIPWMCSTLSVSPMKDAVRINEIGNRVAEKHGIKWLGPILKNKTATSSPSRSAANTACTARIIAAAAGPDKRGANRCGKNCRTIVPTGTCKYRR